ncbi:MAG: helix-turn-helix domain-containing protein [Microbacteriaceae bacterium]
MTLLPDSSTELLTLGKRIRHFRLQHGLTLEQFGGQIGMVASQLSLIENGKREPKLSLLTKIAESLKIELNDLLSAEAPDERSGMEIALEQAQQSSIFAKLSLPKIRSIKSMPDETLETMLGLYRELERREQETIATPEEARRAMTELRLSSRKRNNFYPEIEEIAEELLSAAGHNTHSTGAITHRTVALMAENLGFKLIHVNDLPRSTRSVTDLANGRIYIPPQSIPGGHGLRSLALQAIAHRVLGHSKPENYADFLQQRLEINYFAAACLMPRTAAVQMLQKAKQERNMAVEDLRDAFGVTHETAAHRFTNLATSHLDLQVHFLRVDDDGALSKAYENDGLRLPVDVTGAIEGQVVCRRWAARTAFDRTNRTSEFYQFTDTPEGTFWCTSQIGSGTEGEFSISFGVRFDDARWFRGRDTKNRSTSTCPDENCCRKADPQLQKSWSGSAWPSARVHAHIFSPLPSGDFPGVDDTEVFEFLERHAHADQSQ